MTMMMMRIKRPFTLLEITLTIAVLAIVASFTSIGIKQMVDRHSFNNEITTLFSSLQEAQVIACTYQTDLSLELFQKKERLYYRFSTLEPLPRLLFSQETKKLSTVGKLLANGIKEAKVRIDIYAGGRVTPSTLLTFIAKGGGKLCIDLQKGHLIKVVYGIDKPCV
ncbi:MAG: hypothetical protein RLZZ453_753 [Chlamydiota bacterium]|jgi:type II secretory pathway pseudopilin PulG